MKKLQLKALEFGASELLSRAQLQKIVGGTGGGDNGKVCGPAGACNTNTCKLTCSGGQEIDGTCGPIPNGCGCGSGGCPE